MNQTPKPMTLVGISMILLFASGCFSCKHYLANKIKPQQFDGIVLQIESEPCWKSLVIEQGKMEVNLNICVCGMADKKWQDIQIGDRIINEKGSTIIRLVRNNQVELESEFPCCDH